MRNGRAVDAEVVGYLGVHEPFLMQQEHLSAALGDLLIGVLSTCHGGCISECTARHASCE